MTTSSPIIMIQARSGSKRLPQKVLADVCGRPVLDWVIYRCSRSRLAGGVVVLTSDREHDEAIAALSMGLGIPVYRGSEDDVLLRYVSAARQFRAQVIVRITADCPFIDSEVIDEVIDLYRRRPADYVCVKDYPGGIGDAEVIRLSALETVLARTTPADTYYREHVITYLTDRPSEFDVQDPMAHELLRRPDVRLSIDTFEDLKKARSMAEFFHPSRDFHVAEILAWVDWRRSVPRTQTTQP